MTSSIVALLPIQPAPPSTDPAQIILCTEWSTTGDQIQFRLFSPLTLSKSLEATLSLSELRQRAEEFEIPAEDFIQQTRQCLTTNHGLEGFKYFYTEDRDFTWKKTTGSLTLIYGTVQLTPSTATDGLVGVLTRLQVANGELQADKGKLLKENQDLILSHQQLIEAQKNTATDTLSKCRLLINSKKAKIRELEEKLQKQQQQPPVDDDERQNPEEEPEEDSETPMAISFAGRKRNTINRIVSQSSQHSSSDDSIPLAFLPKRKDVANKRNPVPSENCTPEPAALSDQPESQDCNGLFDDL